MKKLVSVTEVDGEGLTKLLGENVLIMCLNFYYAGKLVGVNKDCILLENAHIVYATGDFSSKSWETAEKLPGPWYVQIQAIESFGISGK